VVLIIKPGDNGCRLLLQYSSKFQVSPGVNGVMITSINEPVTFDVIGVPVGTSSGGVLYASSCLNVCESTVTDGDTRVALINNAKFKKVET
jgi:hypothetical protein